MSALGQQKACRSCKATIQWALTPKGAKVPLDPEGEVPVEHLAHAYVVDLDYADLPQMRKFDPATDKVGRVSHFRTCKDAQLFSKGGRHQRTQSG